MLAYMHAVFRPLLLHASAVAQATINCVVLFFLCIKLLWVEKMEEGERERDMTDFNLEHHKAGISRSFRVFSSGHATVHRCIYSTAICGLETVLFSALLPVPRRKELATIFFSWCSPAP